jgi:mRNA interferase HigB
MLHIIAQSTLKAFWEKSGRRDSEGPLRAWHAEAEASTWTGPADVKKRFPTASFVEGNRVVFNIGGNKSRLVIAIRYRAKRAYVLWIGTHNEYDKIDVSKL